MIKVLRFDLPTMLVVCQNDKLQLKKLFLGMLGYRTFDNNVTLMMARYKEHKIKTKVTDRSYIINKEETLKALLSNQGKNLVLEYLIVAGSRSYYQYRESKDPGIDTSIDAYLLESATKLTQSTLVFLQEDKLYLAPEHYTFDKW